MTDSPTCPPAGDGAALFHTRCERPLLVATFARRQAMLSWAMARPGFQFATEVAWLEVARADLTLAFDAFAHLDARLAAAGLEHAVAMMTSRDVRTARQVEATSGAVRARCLATVGLNNAVRAASGAVPGPGAPGTINLLAAVSIPLAAPALLEAASIAVEARTAAVIALGWPAAGGLATGTGTDCVVVAAPEGEGGAVFAGLHTDVGCAIAAAVYDAVADAGRRWIAERTPGTQSPTQAETGR